MGVLSAAQTGKYGVADFRRRAEVRCKVLAHEKVSRSVVDDRNVHRREILLQDVFVRAADEEEFTMNE